MTDAAPSATIVQSNTRAMVLMVVAGLLFAAAHASVKFVSREVHPFEVVFFRNVWTLALLLPLFWRGRLSALRSRRLPMHFTRGVLQCGAVIGLFMGLSLIPLAEATALSFTSPLFAAIGATLLFGEPGHARRWIAVVAGFAGVLLIVRPGFQTVGLGTALMIGSALLFAVTKMMSKSLARTESTPVIVAYVSFVITPVSLVAALFVWTWPTPEQFLWLSVVGLISTAAQMLLVQAYRHADMTVVEPLSFVRMLWAALIGYLVFAEMPDGWTWIGAGVIFAAATMLARGESRS